MKPAVFRENQIPNLTTNSKVSDPDVERVALQIHNTNDGRSYYLRYNFFSVYSRSFINQVVDYMKQNGFELPTAIFNIQERGTDNILLYAEYGKEDIVVSRFSTDGYDFASVDDAKSFIMQFKEMKYDNSFSYTKKGFYNNRDKALKLAYDTIEKAAQPIVSNR